MGGPEAVSIDRFSRTDAGALQSRGTMSNLISTISAQIAGPLVDLLCVVIVAGIGAATRLLIAHTKNVRVQGVLGRLDVASEAAVRSVAQTEVDALKAGTVDGKLTPEQAKAASEKAMAIVKSNLGEKGIADLKNILGVDDITALISTHNEATVHRISSDAAPTTVNAPVAVSAPEGAQPMAEKT